MSGKTAKNAHLWERADHDWYVEEREPTAELFKREMFPPGGIWDPCCGRGHVLAEAVLAGHLAWGSDLIDRRRVVDCPFIQGAFEHFPVALAPSVVFNPPYLEGKGIEAFIRQAMRYRSVDKIAAFVPSKWLWGQKRARGMHTELPPSAGLHDHAAPLLRRPAPSGSRRPEEVGGGAEDFAWAVYDRCPTRSAVGRRRTIPATQLLWIT
jgi:hypothetical protein